MQMNSGSLDGIQLLTPESVSLMHKRHVPLSGFDFPGMELYGLGMGWILWGGGAQGHTGGIPEYLSQMIYKEANSVPYGVVMMMNTGCSVVECDFEWMDETFVAIQELLMEHAGDIAAVKD